MWCQTSSSDTNIVPVWIKIAQTTGDNSLSDFERAQKLAVSYSLAQEWETALKWAERALKLDEDNQEIIDLRSKILTEMNK